MQTFWQDLRYGARMLMKEPGFTLASVIALALGIGANIAIFSFMMTVLVRPLPFREPESLVYLWNKNQALGVSQGYFTQDDILAFREQATTCAQITAWTISGVDVKNVKPERVEGMLVNSNFFQTLGVQPLLGRAFNNDDDGDAIISYGLWQRQFGGDPNLIGEDVNLMDVGSGDRTLIGVLAPEFDFPQRTEAWLRDDLERGRSGNHYLRAITRLKPGVTPQQAQAELNMIARVLAQQSPATNTGWEVSAVPFREYLFGSTRIALPLLLGAVGCVLLIACANIANLQLTRASARQKEIAVRLALEAGRRRLLAFLGAASGLLLALWGIHALRAVGPSSIPRLSEVNIKLLAASGIYGVISYSVAERTREIGIRLALGAQGSDVLKLITRQGMKLVFIGIALGLLVSFALTRLMKSLLFGVSAIDPLIFGIVMLMLALVALLACYIPGRRATKVDPLVALRCE